MKRTYDLRGRQSSIFRLARFDPEGFLHALIYRILIFLSIVYGLVLLLANQYPQLYLAIAPLTAAVWILFTFELFEFIKGIALAQTKGLAFGRFQSTYREVQLRHAPHAQIFAFTIAPYLAVIIWLLGFAAMVMWWH
ncbi:MAG: hypothetical protein KGH61_03475 [Candidatus Micrarchaeota archaeon]|nr:hypothetical protein [Candidatus Micrarchaeota archaeon]MDE1847983.1 hypothetical protein [Candidatus Micrarchaeota archaeon]MDE1864674.1 hypothetical protein [Candidatus Micrarchaeota archaeon]